MKTVNTLLFAGAVVAGLMLAQPGRADQAASPRVRANQTKYVSGTEASPSLVSGDYLGAAAKTSAMFQPRVSGSTDITPSLVSGNYPGAAAKASAMFPATVSASSDFEIAPVVEKGNASQPSCCQGKQGQPTCCHGK